MHKFPLLKNSTLTSSYFKSNFKLIKECVKERYFFPLKIFSSLVWRILSSVENVIQCREFYPVQREFYPMRRLLSSVEFYPGWRILSSVENFIQCLYFHPVRRLLFGAQTFIQCREFYPVQGILSLAENFIQFVVFYSAADNFIQCGEFFIEAFFPKQTEKKARTKTIVWDFKNYSCNEIIVKEY